MKVLKGIRVYPKKKKKKKEKKGKKRKEFEGVVSVLAMISITWVAGLMAKVVHK